MWHASQLHWQTSGCSLVSVKSVPCSNKHHCVSNLDAPQVPRMYSDNSSSSLQNLHVGLESCSILNQCTLRLQCRVKRPFPNLKLFFDISWCMTEILLLLLVSNKGFDCLKSIWFQKSVSPHFILYFLENNFPNMYSQSTEGFRPH